MSSLSAFPSVFPDGTSGKSNGTFGKLEKSSALVSAGGGADAGGGIFGRGCGFGVFKFCRKKNTNPSR